MITDIIKVAGMAIQGTVNYFAGSQEIRKAKEDGKIAILKAEANEKIAVSEARISMAKGEQGNNYSLDKIALQAMEKSYKDEVVLAVFLTPMIMAFIPGYAEYIETGFDVISRMPDWYMYLIVGMIVTIYGLRGLLTKVLDGKMSLFGGNKAGKQ